VLDPPRAGAEAQCRQLILSSLDTVIMVSCDPGTFVRDAALLAGAGFAPERIVPVDQFAWSAHIEIAAIFRRRRAGRGRRR
jgi:23S rRNA (uracil1939-C5)-methyltransferase